MKMVLFQEFNCLDLEVKAKYLERKGIPFWVYFYSPGPNTYTRRPYNKAELAHADFEDYISLVDKGFSFTPKYPVAETIEGSFFPVLDEIRYDEDLIALIEENPDDYESGFEVVNIEPGRKYRILAYDNYEVVEFLDSIPWLTAS